MASSSKSGIDKAVHDAVLARRAKKTLGNLCSAKLKQSGLKRARASAKAREEVPSSPDALVVDEKPSASAPLGALIKRAYQQIIQ